MTHEQLMELIREICKWRKFPVFHAYDSRRCWGPGFPDLVIVGRSRVIFREVKTEHDKLDAEQRQWGYALQAAGEEWAVWRPSDWWSGRIKDELQAIAAGQAFPVGSSLDQALRILARTEERKS